MAELSGEAVGAMGTAAGLLVAFGRELWARLKGERSDADIGRALRDELREELDRRDEECARRMQILTDELRAEFHHEKSNMRALIRALALKLPLDAKLQRMLDEIAPLPSPAHA